MRYGPFYNSEIGTFNPMALIGRMLVRFGGAWRFVS